MTSITIDNDLMLEVKNLANKTFDPVEGFMGYNEIDSVLKNKRLENNKVWTIPIILPTTKEQTKNINEGDTINLNNNENQTIANLKVEEKFYYDKTLLASKTFGTTDLNHPGVKKLHQQGHIFLSGKIKNSKEFHLISKEHELTPTQTKEIFKKLGWKTIAGFQTRNVPHRAHEYLQKAALEHVDGLFIQPLLGWKKPGDFQPETIIEGYQQLIKNYFPKNTAILGALTTSMRYAGPREAVFHALIRKNHGCTHFIVGRDHAGVGNYYKKYEAHEIFKQFDDLGIEIMKMKGPFYCKTCNHVATEKTCPHNSTNILEISGTDIRNMISNNKIPPNELMRKEVSEVIKNSL